MIAWSMYVWHMDYVCARIHTESSIPLPCHFGTVLYEDLSGISFPKVNMLHEILASAHTQAGT